MGPKINLFNSNWVDTVFEDRNQNYGAYVLRKENGKTSFIAFLLGGLFFSLLIASPVISKSLFGDSQKEAKEEVLTEKIVLADIPVEVPPVPEVIIEKQVKSLVEVVKHVPPVIVEKEEVEVEMKSVDDFKEKITGSDNVAASDDGEIVLEGKASEVKVDGEIIEDKNKVFTIVEVKPDYPGGMAEFYKYVKNNFRVPEDLGSNGMIIVNFIVEVDGSLTDIKVIRDMGYGTGKEAIRILKNAKKWNPGVQNGRNVRVLYTLPIRINTQ